MPPAQLHIIKLCVGVEHPQELIDWQIKRRAQTGRDHAFHVTRMWPRREEELLDGGSIYWVMKGFIKARQRIIGLDRVTGEDGIARCAILLDSNLVNVELTPRRAFQGWRYLEGAQIPRDSETGSQEIELPDTLAYELAQLGVR